ncbi:hypothetical protein K9B33_17895 [Sphingobium sp. 3R8]|uniref:hypothetical protein n=1 Tax=Sphingobium sp. 3R8 TaxID=2874921 RepID=UPI001CCB8984|nr:hypothetical protein [Sphingobium sp. 3R8]MBZ9649411.1 hypothetical protein [Sphingobium sp. 3R8]
MKKIREDRVIAMADWLETIPTDPPFYKHPDWENFLDLSDAEISACEDLMRVRAAGAESEAAKLRAELDHRHAAPKPQPIDTALKNGGWILGHVPKNAPYPYNHPWVILTWGDEGWAEDDGGQHEPIEWLPLPDPQPTPTGWAPASGIIKIAEITGKGWKINGQPAEVPWRWEVYIEKPDGSIDDYRELWHYATIDQAQARAIKWRDKFGLPVVTVSLDQKVVAMLPPVTRQ